MPTWYLLRGYSMAVIAHNVRSLEGSGWGNHAQAIDEAHRLARLAFRRHRPDTRIAFPRWIYKKAWTKAPQQGPRENPAARSNPSHRALAPFDGLEAARLYRQFNGAEARTDARIGKPRIPDAMACIGQVTVVQYVAERDGEVNEYRHAFRKKSRPHLCISPDGKLVLMLGGAFRFGEDGFEDE